MSFLFYEEIAFFKKIRGNAIIVNYSQNKLEDVGGSYNDKRAIIKRGSYRMVIKRQ